jgi:hypothetical protein
MKTQTTTKTNIWTAMQEYTQKTDEYMAKREAANVKANKNIPTYYSGSLDEYVTIPQD